MTDNEINEAVAVRVFGKDRYQFNPTESHDDFFLALGKLPNRQKIIYLRAMYRDAPRQHYGKGDIPGELATTLDLITAPLRTKCLALLEAVKTGG